MATILVVFPWASIHLQRALKARWSRQLLDVLGVQLRVAGRAPRAGLLVSNHISWLDIYAINALAPTAFVSKDDVRGWPVIGWLSARTETLFLERGSRNAAMRAKEAVVGRLRERVLVGVFPEGTTSNGEGVLPFHSALFESAIEAGAIIRPLALRYTGRDGKPSQATAYVGETTLWQSLSAITSASDLSVHVTFLPEIDPAQLDRRHLAHRTHTLIASRVARPGADREPETLSGLPGEPQSGSLPTDNPSPALSGSPSA